MKIKFEMSRWSTTGILVAALTALTALTCHTGKALSIVPVPITVPAKSTTQRTTTQLQLHYSCLSPPTTSTTTSTSTITNQHDEVWQRRRSSLNRLRRSTSDSAPPIDRSQLLAIHSNAPAVLLSAGPGTGKSHVLSLRIAHLLLQDNGRDNGNDNSKDNAISIAILSFSKRDAERLRRRALIHITGHVERQQADERLWSGTVHSLSLGVLNGHLNGHGTTVTVRVVSMRERRNWIAGVFREGSREVREREWRALIDVGQSRSILVHNVVRCIDLWKEALLIPSLGWEWEGDYKYELLACDERDREHAHSNSREERVRDDCVELAMRLGIPQTSALLALDVVAPYQARHAASGTADLSDLAGMAHRHLLNHPNELQLLREKFRHIIVDEYQDMSVSQHALLRLLVRGEDVAHSSVAVPILLDPSPTQRNPTKRQNTSHQSYNVPNLFCAGDTHQSIYGWRAASPMLTVDGFKLDYPQGVVASLRTCYRLPGDILEASNMLLPVESDGEGDLMAYRVSPAAASKVVSILHVPRLNGGPDQSNRTGAVKRDIRLGESLLLSKGMQKLDSSVLIHGLWDSREEAKYIAATIRRRSKERTTALISAMKSLHVDPRMDYPDDGETQLDLTDVAVMVRSANQIDLIKEVLSDYGIPFQVENDKDDGDSGAEVKSSIWSSRKSKKPIPMRPVLIMTMHRSKGEEFDDVYLTGWTEGTFPHPEAVTSNRIHEERRLAYVALTRARQRVLLTHSLVQTTLHYGKDGTKRHITAQVQPSRFLYELVPSKRRVDGIPASHDGSIDRTTGQRTVWNRNVGIKDYVAGQNVPDFFQKAYQHPKGFVARRADLRRYTSLDVDAALFETKSSPDDDSLDSNLGMVTPDRHGVFTIGDKVSVVDNHHSNYGRFGTVNKVSKCYVFFVETDTERTIQIKPEFLELTGSKTAIASKSTGNISVEERDLQRLTVGQLKARLREVGLRVGGRKSELVDRLVKWGRTP